MKCQFSKCWLNRQLERAQHCSWNAVRLRGAVAVDEFVKAKTAHRIPTSSTLPRLSIYTKSVVCWNLN
uniref:Uncharacterized protein n=1 Tax=Arundo donax TaxID=35708 RepID=A0A0A9GR39_ARUDO